jgi:hypothetical protein
MQDFARRLLLLVLIVVLTAGWLRARPASPQRILTRLQAIPCTAFVSNAPETLVP